MLYAPRSAPGGLSVTLHDGLEVDWETQLTVSKQRWAARWDGNTVVLFETIDGDRLEMMWVKDSEEGLLDLCDCVSELARQIRSTM